MMNVQEVIQHLSSEVSLWEKECEQSLQLSNQSFQELLTKANEAELSGKNLRQKVQKVFTSIPKFANWQQSKDVQDLIDRIDSISFFIYHQKAASMNAIGKLKEALELSQYAKQIACKQPLFNQASFFSMQSKIFQNLSMFDDAEITLQRAIQKYKDMLEQGGFEDPKYAILIKEAILHLEMEYAFLRLQQGNRSDYMDRYEAALERCKKDGFTQLFQENTIKYYKQLNEWDASGEVDDKITQKAREIKEKLKSLNLGTECYDKIKAEINEIRALVKMKNQGFSFAEPKLLEAIELMKKYPSEKSKLVSLYITLSNVYMQMREIENACDAANHAVTYACQVGELKQICVALINALGFDSNEQRYKELREEVMQTLLNQPNSDDLALLMQQKAFDFFQNGDWDKSLELLIQALELAREFRTRLLILRGQAALYKQMGKKEQSLESLVASINILNQEIHSISVLNLQQSADMIHQIDNLYKNTGLLYLELNRIQDAIKIFDIANQKIFSIQLKHEKLENFQIQAPEMKDVTQSNVSPCIFLYFQVMEKSSVVIVFDEMMTNPQKFYIPLQEDDVIGLNKKLKQHDWTNFRQTMTDFSTKIFVNELEEILKKQILLKIPIGIIPDSKLAVLPIGGFVLDNKFLVEYDGFEVFITPTFTSYLKIIAQPPRLKQHCLFVGSYWVDDIRFSDQIRSISRDISSSTIELVTDDNGPIELEELYSSMLEKEIIHFSCHGVLDETASSLESVKLELSPERKISAKSILESNINLKNTLIFLNACVSGTYEVFHEAVVGGFAQAFFRCGATSVINTVGPISPNVAEFIARRFYKRYINDQKSAATSLLNAQREALKKFPGIMDWAKYVLIGDPR